MCSGDQAEEETRAVLHAGQGRLVWRLRGVGVWHLGSIAFFGSFPACMYAGLMGTALAGEIRQLAESCRF